jgi:hypothetical protein
VRRTYELIPVKTFPYQSVSPPFQLRIQHKQSIPYNTHVESLDVLHDNVPLGGLGANTLLLAVTTRPVELAKVL